MSHHSTDRPLIPGPTEEKMREMFKTPTVDLDALARQEKALKSLEAEIGPTGGFPAGRMALQDEGGLMFGITVFNGRVVIDFGKPVRSIGFTRKDALELAKALKANAERCPPIIGEPDPEDTAS